MTTNDVLTRECPGPVAERAFASPRRGLRARRNRAWHWALVIHWSLVIGGLVISPASAQPNVSGSGNSSITDKETTTPFDNLNISSSSDVTVTITFPAAQGTLSPLAPFFTQSGDTYTLDATNDSGATDFLKTLTFTPAENRVPVGTFEVTTFIIIADDGSDSDTNNAFRVFSESTNDPPTIGGTTASTAIFDKDTATPFSNVMIDDVDPGTLLDVTITLLNASGGPGGVNGALQNLDGFTHPSSSVYRLTGRTPTSAQASTRALVFQPRTNFWAVGTNELTQFKIVVTDNEPDSSATNIDTTVTATSWNDPPVITGTLTATQQVATGNRIFPFAAANLSDVDVGGTVDPQETVLKQPLTIKISFIGTNVAGRLSSSDFFLVGTNYVSSAMPPSQATTALRNLAYIAPTVPLPGPIAFGLIVTVTDDPAVEAGKSAIDTNTKIQASTPYQAVSIRGTQAGRQVSDKQTIAPFPNVTVESLNGQPIVALVSLDSTNGTKGQLSNLGGFTHLGSQPDVYAYTNFSEQVTTVMRQLLFQPTENRILGSNTEVTTFTVMLLDKADPSFPHTNLLDTTTTTITIPVNDRPTIVGATLTTPTITDSQTNRPFPTVSIADVDERGLQNVTVTVSLDDAGKGSFLPLAGVSAVAPGTNQFSGTASNVTALIQQLIFQPTPDRLPVGLTETVAFNIHAADNYGGFADNTDTHVRVLSVNGAPVIILPNPQPISLVNTPPIRPFLQVGIQDDDTNLVVVVSLPSAATGALTNLGGFTRTSASPPTYQFSGYATNATAAIQQLEFLPLVNAATFTITATDSASNVTSRTLAVVLRNQNKTFVVTNTLDYDPNPTNTPIAGSLRKALSDAGENDHIAFAIRSMDPMQPDLPAVIRLTAPLVLNKNVSINGPGANLLGISGDTQGDGTNDVSVFIVEADVTIKGVTIRDGIDPFAGGGIEVLPGGSLALSYCAITNCTAGQWGGGIDIDLASLSMDHCLLCRNSTSSGVGQGGGGVSIFTTNECFISNCTFSGNTQGDAAGLGGGALYVENSNPAFLLKVNVTSCTFKGNRDNARRGSAIRTNVSKTSVRVKNTITADGQGNNMEVDQTGGVISLGGNISDDSTRSIFSQGGAPYDIILFDHISDFTQTNALLGELRNNLGPTLSHAPLLGSPAIGHALNNDVGTDQRGYWRSDGQPDSGAIEYNSFRRVVLNEIFADAPAGAQFLEFYVPRDADALNLTGFQVFVDGALRHTFTAMPLPRAMGVVLQDSAAVPVLGGTNQVSSVALGLNPAVGTIVLQNPLGQEVLRAAYVGNFDPPLPPYAGKSINLNPDFAGFSYIPADRVVGGSTITNSPGLGSDGSPLGPGNAPPSAFADTAATDQNTAVLIDVLTNDHEPDRPDVLKVVSVQPSGVPVSVAATNFSVLGAVVSINTSTDGLIRVSYDPTGSSMLRSLPVGAQTNDTFTYTILDYEGGTNAHDRLPDSVANLARATATVTVTVLGLNDAPTPTNDLVATTEDLPLTINVQSALLNNDADPDTDDNKNTLLINGVNSTPDYTGNFVTTSLLGASVSLEIRFNRLETNIRYDPTGSAILNALSAGEITNDTFYYTVVDSHGAVGSAAVTVRVTGVNDPPVAYDDVTGTDEDTPILIPLGLPIANDTDVDTDDNGTTQITLHVSGVDAFSALGARVSLTSTGIVYDPRLSTALQSLVKKQITVDTFSYTISDGHGGTSHALIHVTVVGVNDTPVAVADAATTTEDDILITDAAHGLLANDSDRDIDGTPPDDLLRALPLLNGPTTAGGKVTIYGDGSYKYDPTGSEILNSLAQGETMVDSFTYTNYDTGLTFANDDFFTVKGDSSANVLTVLDNDTVLSGIGGSLSIVSVDTPNHGGTVSIAPMHDSLNYAPQVTFSGIETFTYTMSDGKGGYDFATVSVKVQVNKLNGIFPANSDHFTVAKGTSAVLDVLANDVLRPDTITDVIVSSVSSPTHGSAAPNATSDRILYAPVATFVGDDTFNYQISAGGVVTTGVVTITVVDRNNGLNINEDVFTVLENSGGNLLDVLANDDILPGPGPALTITALRTNGVMGTVSITPAGDRVRYVPPQDFVGDDSFNYDIADAVGGTAMALVRVHVVASAFAANDDIFTVPINSANVSLPVLVNDSLVPNFGQSLQITTVGIGSNAPNRGATVTIDDSGTHLIYTPVAIAPTNLAERLETFSYEISYGTLERAVGHVTVRLINRTNVLEPADDAFSIARNSVANVLPVLANDHILPNTNNNLHLVRVIDPPSQGGTVSIGGDALVYTPRLGFIGREMFSYEIGDTEGGSGSANVTVDVVGLFAGADTFSVLTDTTANPLDVLANDNILPENGSIYTITSFDDPPGGSVSLSGPGPNNWLLYTPRPGFFGADHFRYYIVDNTGGTLGQDVTVNVALKGSDRAVGTANITVLGRNDPPIITGTVAGQTVYQDLTIHPFAGVTITEFDHHGLQPLVVTVSLDSTTKGYLSTLGGFIDLGNGVYRIGTSNAGVTAAMATTALRGLTFVPTTGNRVPPGGSETTAFTISADDGFPPLVTDSATTVTALNAYVTRLPTVNVPSNDNYGQPVATTRDTVVVGSPFDKNLGGQAVGAAYVFVWRPGTAGQWDLVKEIQAPDGLSGDQFGSAVAIDRDTIAVGAPERVENGKASGVVYVFGRNIGGSNQWGFVKKIVASDAAGADLFGGAVAISADTLVVGAKERDDSGNNSGSVYVFERNLGGANQWGQSRKVLAPDGRGGDQFGSAVALSGDILAVGVPFRNDLGSASGSVSVFERNFNPTNPVVPLSNNWGLRKKLLASDGVANDQFGSAVCVSGGLLISGAPFANPLASASGAAYTFDRNAGGSNNWGQIKKLVPADGMGNDQFGGAVAVSGDTVVIGARLSEDQGQNAGSAYVYRRNFDPAARAIPSSNNWGLIEKLLPLPGGTNSHFGFSTAISGNTVVIGSAFEGNAQRPDATYIFRLKFNNAPLFAQDIPDQSVTAGSPFNYTVPVNLFADVDVDDSLVFTAATSDGSPLPAWLSFNPLTVTFSGTPSSNDVGTISIQVTMTDQDFASSINIFTITVNPLNPPPPPPNDYDGSSHLYEYSFGSTPPPDGDTILMIDGRSQPGNVYLSYRRRCNDPRLKYSVIFSDDLAHWFPGDALLNPVRTVPVSEAFQNVTLILKNPSVPVRKARIFRIRVTFQN